MGFEDLGFRFGFERLENNNDYRVSKGKGKSVWQRIDFPTLKSVEKVFYLYEKTFIIALIFVITINCTQP